MPCKHKIEQLAVYEKHDSRPDGYGGDNEWTWYEFGCNGCKTFIDIGYKYCYNKVDENRYFNVTGRELSIEECKKIFINNKALYGFIDISHDRHDIVLRSVGKRTDKLERKIAAKKKLIKKHKEELIKMLNDYNGNINTWSDVMYL